ncbi:MAG: hypothetical protein IJF65_06475, partial [Clostridia bacterium]|nr:hypothetical protein [Clostridia bacterium]
MMKLDGRFCRLMCALLCAVMLLGLLPSGVPEASAANAVYGRIIKDEVKFRYSASSSSGYKFKMALNTIVEVTKDKGETSWYGIEATEPGQSYASNGYCAADCLEVLTDAEVEAWLQVGAPMTFAPVEGGSTEPTPTPTPTPTPAPTPVPAPTIKGYIKILDRYTEANLRDGVGGKVAHKWKRAEHATLPYLEHITPDNWYKVQYGDEIVYIDGTVVQECEQDGGAKILGYVTIIDRWLTEGVNLRDSVDGDVELVWKVSAYKTLPYIEKLSSNWYRVRYGSDIHYVNGTVVKECEQDGSELGSEPDPTPTP